MVNCKPLFGRAFRSGKRTTSPDPAESGTTEHQHICEAAQRHPHRCQDFRDRGWLEQRMGLLRILRWN